MRKGMWALLLVIALLAQTGLLARHLPAQLRPDPVLLLALFAAARAEQAEALGFCWLAGLGRDLLSVGPLGEYALLYFLAGLGMTRVRKLLDVRLPMVQAASAFLAYSLVEGIYLGTTMLICGNLYLISGTGALFSGALVTAAIAPLFCWALGLPAGPLGLNRRRWAQAG